MPPLRLRWSHTWPDKGADFTAKTEAGQLVGRIHKTFKPGGGEHWVWYGHGRFPYRNMGGMGTCETKGEAARALEARWFAFLAEIDRAGATP